MTLAPETESKTWIRNHTTVFCGRNYSCMSKIPASGINVLIFSPYFIFSSDCSLQSIARGRYGRCLSWPVLSGTSSHRPRTKTSGHSLIMKWLLTPFFQTDHRNRYSRCIISKSSDTHQQIQTMAPLLSLTDPSSWFRPKTSDGCRSRPWTSLFGTFSSSGF